jgi:hypothetical protein
MDQQPSVCRTVLYSRPQNGIEEAMEVPAIVTDVWDAEGGGVKLTAFPPDCAPEPVAGIVKYDAEGGENTWAWPPRV